MNFRKPSFWDLPKQNIISYLLLPFSLPIILKNFFFNFTKREKTSKIKTICVGNIYIGGTGKTPLTIKLYELLKKKNYNVATVKKNYSNQIDEQLLLKQKTSLIVSKSRKLAIEEGIKKKFDILIFDDGLQDSEIDYDLKLVCFKSKNWIGNGQCIPAGPMREKLSSLNKFQAVFLNGDTEDFEKREKQIKNINTKIKVFKTQYKIQNIDKYDLNFKYLIFSGIGNPSDFKDILIKNNFNIVKEFIFPDHYNYKYKDIEKIQNFSKKENLKIITTEKDYVKIPNELKNNIKCLAIDTCIFDEDNLLNFLKENL